MDMNAFLEQSGLTKEALTHNAWELIPSLSGAIFVLLSGSLFYMITRRLIEAGLKRTPMQRSLIRITVRTVYKWLVILLTIIFALSQLGFNVTAALAGVGVLGIAVGFAAQQTLSNVISGFGIFIDHLYRVGDWVTINDHYGEVVSISLRTTKIRTLDNTFVSLPNSLVTNTSVTNFSEQGMVRISAKVAIPYAEDIEKARKVLVEAARHIEGIRRDPEPEVVVDALADSGVNLLLRIWIDNARQEQQFTFRLTELCKKALDEAGITIPFPQRDVHMIGK
ncbi:hypothetical protein CL638_01855 [bacterium]|nr:hypothetical protein [bacterium]